MSIKKIAEICGISTSTVSRILNNKPDVNPETRERVISAMNQLSFRPNVMTNRNETIGVITPYTAWPEFMGELMSGLMATAFSFGKHLTLIPMHGKSIIEMDDVSHFCRSNGLCGMMVINPNVDSKLPHALVEHQIPHVIIAATYRNSDVSWVDVDNIAGSAQAVSHLIKSGHRRVALFHNYANTACEVDRMEGYKQTLTNNDISYDRELVVELTDHVDLPREINRLMALREPPTSLFCTTHRGTLLVANCLQRLQLRIPEDISVVGFGDYEVSPLMNPPLTTIHQPIYDMGKMAASVMEELTKQQKYSKIQKMLPTQLKIRKSTRILR